jgi:hypothetical protein
MVVEEFAGTTKSVMISGSLAVTMATNVTKRTAFSKVEAMVLVYISFQQIEYVMEWVICAFCAE